MKIEPVKPISYDGIPVKSGDEVPDGFGRQMIKNGCAVKYVEVRNESTKKTTSGTDPSQTADKKPSETRSGK